MSPIREVPCRVDYRPADANGFCEWTGRIDHLSTTGCTVRSSHQPDPGARLELRIYLPGSDWPMCVNRSIVAWTHWGEFTVEFVDLPIQDRDGVRRCLIETSFES
jgi:hypothetical protein